MSANLDLVRSIYAAWERGDRSSVEWAHPEIEVVIADGPSPASWTGLAGMAEAARDFVSAWEDLCTEAEEYRELDDKRVLVLDHRSGRGKTSGLELSEIRTQGAHLFHIRDGKVTRLVRYMDPDRALADLELASQGAESTTPDLAELMRTQLEALTRNDLDAALRFYAPDCVMELELGPPLEGVSAIRAFLEEFLGSYDEFEWELEEVLDLGNGVTFAVIRLHGRPVGSSGHVQMRLASVAARTDELVTWVKNYTETDIEKARAAAERLAEERG